MDIKDWDVAAANNTTAAPDGWPENMNYSQVNDTGRENMAVLARWFKDINGSLTTTGSANTYSITLNAGYSSYFDGMMFACRFNVANTGATTINVNGIGNRSIFDRNGDALHPGAIDTGATYMVMHNATNFVFLGDVIPSLNGERMYLDLDRDSYFSSFADDQLDIVLGGATNTTFGALTDWTPIITASGGSGTITYTARSGKYVRTNGGIYFRGEVFTSSLASRTGQISIDGLPENVNSSNYGTCNYSFASGLNVSSGERLMLLPAQGTTRIDMYIGDATLTTNSTMQSTEWTDDGRIIFGGFYFT